MKKTSTILGVGHRAVRSIFQDLAEYFAPLTGRLCSTLVIGGLEEKVQLDKISFRSAERRHGIVWVRYLPRFVEVPVLFGLILFHTGFLEVIAGWRGPISIAEMRQHLLDSDDYVLTVGSVRHTDNAKAELRNWMGFLLAFEGMLANAP